ncbi:polysaccharide deacetylase family protein [Streptomyces sp. NPDC001941]|uniref:polysaccharide deacetylase family protein n=1 Tax=Streptomyces sp. NPDC001941 TaxID=3154659 RepID=UPI003326BD75
MGYGTDVARFRARLRAMVRGDGGTGRSVRGMRWEALVAGIAMAAVVGALLLVLPDGRAEEPAGKNASAQMAKKVETSISRKAESGGKAVNLTLDDGPDPRWTPKFLALLKANGVKATFCMVGPNAQRNPELVKRVVADGHRLCDHSMSHDVSMDRKPVAYQEKEILEAKRLIEDASGGAPVRYYRAPGGAFTPESRKIAAEAGMRPLGWNVDPKDFERPGVDKIVSNVKEQLAKGPTVLLHDGGGSREQSLAALERLIPWFKEQGYAFSFPEA